MCVVSTMFISQTHDVVSANKLPSARHQGTWRASRRSEARAAASQGPG